MVALTATVERRGRASLVELVVTNETPAPRRIRVANRLDGPVWPPRSEGVPVDGWDDGGFEGVVGPGERLGLGYASPADPADPPAEIAWSERAAAYEPRSGSHAAAVDETPKLVREIERADAESVVRALGDPRPPRDVVEANPIVQCSNDGSPVDEPQHFEQPDAESGGAARSCAAPPEAVEVWFEAVTERVECGEALAESSSVLDGASAVEQAGSLVAVERLVEQLEADAETLREVEERAAALAERAEGAADEVPLSSFRRLS